MLHKTGLRASELKQIYAANLIELRTTRTTRIWIPKTQNYRDIVIGTAAQRELDNKLA